MKMKHVFLMMVAVMLCSCQPKAPKVITASEEKAVDTLFIKLHTAMNSKDITLAKAIITENTLSCGTDPSEFISAKELLDMWTKIFSDTSVHVQYTVDKRVIRLSKDGNSAVVIEQYMMPLISTKMQIRSIQHAVKENNQWRIDFLSWNFIPRNDEIALIDKALETPVAEK